MAVESRVLVLPEQRSDKTLKSARGEDLGLRLPSPLLTAVFPHDLGNRSPFGLLSLINNIKKKLMDLEGLRAILLMVNRNSRSDWLKNLDSNQKEGGGGKV